MVDNGSTDGSINALLTEFPDTRALSNHRNRGLAAGNNQGIRASHGRFILISNPDVIYPPGAVDALLALMRRRPQAAFAVAKLVHPDGELQTSAGDLPTPCEALLGQRMSRRRADGECAGVWWHAWPHDEERQVGHGAEACYLVRRAALADIGPQDERFVLDWEGLDWSRRAREVGWQVWFCPEAVVTHLGGVSVRQVPGRWIISTHLGMYRYFSSRTRLPLRPLLALTIGLRGVAKLVAVAFGARLYERARRGED